MDHSFEELANARTEETRLTKFMNMMTKGTNQLDYLLNDHRNPKDKTGLGFQDEINQGETEFVQEQRRIVSKNQESSTAWTKDTRACDYCNKPGHIMCKCKLFLSQYRRRNVRTGVPSESMSRSVKWKNSGQYRQKYFWGYDDSEVCYSPIPNYYSNLYYEYCPMRDK